MDTHPSTVRLVSRSAAPAELGTARDPRIIGVALRRVSVMKGWRLRMFGSKNDCFQSGYHEFEEWDQPDDGIRWTDGDAEIPNSIMDVFEDHFQIEIVLGGMTEYLDDGANHAVA